MPMEDKKLSDATRILQKFASLIKEKSTKHLVKSFLELGLTKNNVYNSMSFEELVALLRTKKVIQTTKHIFQRFLKLAAAMESDNPTEERPVVKINIRIVLAMYMIVCFPGERDYITLLFSTLIMKCDNDLQALSSADRLYS